MKKFWIVLSVCWLWTCSGGGDKATGPEEPPIVVNLTSLTGQAQKGPFNNGTSINVAELSNTLSPTGRNFSSAITDNTGRFAVANVQLESPFVELRATGFYFNEVSNNISDSQLTLYALSDLTNKSSLNVNILTHLEKNRMQVLMSGDNPKTFAQAKLQAQEEVLAIFDYSRANMPASELLDISQGGAANAKLLAISAILQGDQTVGQMSELLANISTDLSADGTLDDSNLQSQLITNTQGLDFAEIRSNLSARFTALGITATIPDFETEINQFLKPPVAQDMSVSTGEDTPINITLVASDPEGESLTYTILEVNNATVTLNGNVATYTPNAHFNGTDTFTFYANDGTSDSNTATVTMTVSAEDDEPNTLDVATTTDEDVAVTVNLSAEEYDGDSYSFAIVTDVSNGTISLNGSTVTYTPNQDFNGEDSFTFEATDDTGRTINVATATITVNAVNDAPVANNITNQVTDENRMMQLNITLDATDVEGDALTYNITSTNNGSVTINDNIATYVPNQDWNGEDTFTYVANDGALDSNSATVTITVNSVNDAPVANDISSSIDEDFTGHTIKIVGDGEGGSDVDEDTLTFSVVSVPSNGNIYNDSGGGIPAGDALVAGDELTSFFTIYNPNENFNGTDTFTFKANDGLLDSNIATVTITVNPVNDAPTTTSGSRTLDEDAELTINLNNYTTDIDEDDLTFNLTYQAENASWATSSNNSEILLTPNENWSGDLELGFTANDGQLSSNTSTISITVNSVNDAPVTSNITQTQDEDNSEASDLSSFTSDVDGDDLTYSIVTDATNGTTSIDGSIVTYTPNANFHGTDSYTYKANDGTVDSNTSTVTITVASVNDAPTVTAGTISTNEDTAATLDLSTLASDIDGDALEYDIPTGPSNGTVSISGTIATYTPNSNWNGTDSFTYEAYDGIADVVVETVTITVNAKLDSFALDHSGIQVSILGDNKDSIVYSYSDGSHGVAEVDFFGNTINNFSINGAYPYALVNSPDGGVYAIVDSFYDDDQTSGTNSFKIIKLDSSFNEEWSFGPYQYNNGRSFAYGATLNGNILTVLSPSPDEGYTKVITFDTVNQVVERVNDYQLLNYHTEIFTLENSYVIFGSSNNFIFINEIDFDGNLLNSSSIDGLHSAYNNVVSKASNGFVIAANDKIIKIDDNFNIDWEYDYSSFETNSVLRSVIEDLDGNLAAVGYTQISGSYYIYLLKLDSSGNMIYQKTYGDSNYTQSGRSIHLDESTFNNYLIRTRWGTESGTENIIINTDKSGNRIN